MTFFTIVTTTLIMTGAILFFYFFEGPFYEKVERFMNATAKSFNRFLLFILPLILILVVFLPISAIKINDSITVFNISISSNYIDLILILFLAAVHTIKEKTHSSFSELFHAYDSKEETKCVVFANQVVACLLFITINYCFLGINSAIAWWVFLLGRFVWLDQIDKTQIGCFKKGIRTQGALCTFLYSCIFGVIFILSYYAAKLIPNTISDGIPWGIAFGSIISLIVMTSCEKVK